MPTVTSDSQEVFYRYQKLLTQAIKMTVLRPYGSMWLLSLQSKLLKNYPKIESMSVS